MRIRSIKPEFWTSKTMAKFSWEDRLLLKALESYVDDNGVGKDDIELIVTSLFPRDYFQSPRETVAKVSEGISRLSQGSLVTRYDTESESLLYIERWNEKQRVDKPQRGRYPRPDGSLEYAEDVDRSKYQGIREGFQNIPETVAPGTGEQGNRGTGVVAESDDSDDGPSKPDKNDRDDIRSVLDHLDQKLQEYDPETRLPNRTQSNLDAARLLLDRDSRTVDQVKAAIDYSQDSEFWRPNIRSMSKLRDKYETLRAQAQSTGQRNGTTQPQPTGSLLWDDEARKKAHERPSYLTDTDHI